MRCWGSLDDVPLHGLYSQIAGTRHHVCGVMTDGHLNCWGKSPAKNAFPSKEYMETYGIERFVQVSVSMYHSCALDDKGHVTCWGTDHASGAMVVPTENVEATSDSSNAAAPDEQDFYGFNEFEENEIGLGGDSQSDGSVKNIVFKQISVGPSTTCAIRYDNSDLMCWGNMESLNLHDGTVKGPFRQVSSGRMGVCAIYDTEAMAEAGIIAEQSLICFGRAAFVTPVHENIVFDQILVSSMVCGVVMEDSSLKCYGGGKNNARAIPEELEIA